MRVFAAAMCCAALAGAPAAWARSAEPNDVAIFPANGATSLLSLAPPTAPTSAGAFIDSPCWTAAGKLVTVAGASASAPSAVVERAPGGRPTVLERLPNAYAVSFGPGCTEFAETRASIADTEVWLYVGARKPFRILRFGSSPDRPQVAWSADGRRAAIAIPGFPASLVVVDVPTGHVIRVFHPSTLDPVELEPQALTSDGSQVVFSGYTEVWVGDVATGAMRRLASNASEAAWSPDNQQIAVAGQDGRIDILDDTGARLMSVDVGRDTADTPAWSPDGHQLAYVYYVGGEPVPDGVGVATLTAGATVVTGVRRLAPTATFIGDPQWSPDGQLLAAARQPFD